MLACDGDRSGGLLSSGSPGEFTGTWKRTVVITSDSCGTSKTGRTLEGVVAINHIGDFLTATFFTSCGVQLSTPGTGSFIDPVVTLTKDLGFACRGSIFFLCCYDVVRELIGTLDGDTVTGEEVEIFTLQPSSSFSCVPSSCQVRGTLELERCPPADCSFQECAGAAVRAP